MCIAFIKDKACEEVVLAVGNSAVTSIALFPIINLLQVHYKWINKLFLYSRFYFYLTENSWDVDGCFLPAFCNHRKILLGGWKIAFYVEAIKNAIGGGIGIIKFFVTSRKVPKMVISYFQVSLSFD